MNKPFISFEGGDGAGKSTLIESIYQQLVSEGKSVLKTRAPGGTQIGAEIRKLVLHHQSPILMNSRCELFLFLADRAQHLEQVILPAIKKGQIVLCDRFNDSTVAYQGCARELDEQKVRSLALFATQNIEPDLTFYLDLDPHIGFKRIQQSKQEHDRIEAEDLQFHQKIRESFHRMALQEPHRIVILDASQSPEQVLNQALGFLYERCF